MAMTRTSLPCSFRAVAKRRALMVVPLFAEEAIHRLKGIGCGAKSTSCPDQLALGLERALGQG